MKVLYLLCSVLLFHLIKVSEPSGKLSIKFVKFRNPGSRSQNGECCDNVLSCISSCEIFIRFCLTVQSRSSSCSLIDFETPVLGDDFFDFTNSLGNGISNPVLYSFDHWTEPFRTKITVLDDDGKNPLGIGRKADVISTDNFIIATTPDVDESKAVKHGKILDGYRSELTIQYRIFCDSGYFKPSCEELCIPRDNVTGHYTCDYDNSRRVCLPHWHGDNCTQYCQPRNDATGHFVCSSEGTKICLSNWYGINCTRYCIPSDDIAGHYTCDLNGGRVCLENWYGKNCVDYCKPTHSYNCSALGEKICTERYYGVNCSNYCHENERGNYHCVDNDTVICTENYYGPNCTVYCTARNDAFGSYSCAEDGSRICNSTWYGPDCEINCENTSNSYCTESGTKLCRKNWHGPGCEKYCMPDNGSILHYHCDADGNLVCVPGWYGNNCTNFTGCIDDPSNSSHYFCDKISGAMICHFGWVGKNCSFKIGTPFTSEPSFTISSPIYASGSGISHSAIVSSTSLSLPESSTAAMSATSTVDGGNEQSKYIPPTFPSLSARSVYALASSKKPLATFSAHEIDKHNSKTMLLTTSNTLGAADFRSSNTMASISLEYNEATTSLNAKTRGGVYPKYTDTMFFNSNIGTASLNAKTRGGVYQENTNTVLSNSGVITPALHEIKETTDTYQRREIRTQSLSSAINDGTKEMVTIEGSSRVQQGSAYTTNTILQSAFSTSQFDGKASVIQRNRTSIKTTDSATLENVITRINQNGTNNSPTAKGSSFGDVTFWLIVGTTVVMSLLLMAIGATKFFKGGKRRISTTKVRTIKIKPASASSERKRFIRSKKIEEESASILPMIWLQLNKQENKQGIDDETNFFY